MMKWIVAFLLVTFVYQVVRAQEDRLGGFFFANDMRQGKKLADLQKYGGIEADTPEKFTELMANLAREYTLVVFLDPEFSYVLLPSYPFGDSETKNVYYPVNFPNEGFNPLFEKHNVSTEVRLWACMENQPFHAIQAQVYCQKNSIQIIQFVNNESKRNCRQEVIRKYMDRTDNCKDTLFFIVSNLPKMLESRPLYSFRHRGLQLLEKCGRRIKTPLFNMYYKKLRLEMKVSSIPGQEYRKTSLKVTEVHISGYLFNNPANFGYSIYLVLQNGDKITIKADVSSTWVVPLYEEFSNAGHNALTLTSMEYNGLIYTPTDLVRTENEQAFSRYCDSLSFVHYETGSKLVWKDFALEGQYEGFIGIRLQRESSLGMESLYCAKKASHHCIFGCFSCGKSYSCSFPFNDEEVCDAITEEDYDENTD